MPAISAFIGRTGTEGPASTREALTQALDGYFASLAAHDPAKASLAKTVRCTENGEVIEQGEGFWKTAGVTTYRLDVLDPEQGSCAAQAVVGEGGELVVFLVRLQLDGGEISEVETIVARKGVASAHIWDAEALREPSPSFTLSIKPAEQSSRLTLMAAADAYWRAFETNGTPDYAPAPLLPNTERYENGLRTTNAAVGDFGPWTAAEQFDRGLFRYRHIHSRRYPVVDVEKGVCVSIVRFGLRSGAEVPERLQGREPLVCEIFAVRSGRIQEIQVVMTALPAGSPTGW